MTYKKPKCRYRYRNWETCAHLLMIILSILALAPFLLLVISSFTDEKVVLNNGYSFFPEKFSLAAYRYLFTQWKMIGRAYGVTALVTVIGTLVGVIIAGMLGYTLSKKDLPGRSVLLFIVVFVMFFNGGLTATYIIYTRILHVKNTIFGLLLPNLLMNGYYVMMFRNYFENHVPKELIESAKIDGASEAMTFFRIVVPVSMPMIVTVGMIVGLTYWNDWINGLYYLDLKSKLQPIQFILNNINENIRFLQNQDLTTSSKLGYVELPSATVRMAIAVVGVLPLLCVFPFIQKWFIRGITEGALKG